MAKAKVSKVVTETAYKPTLTIEELNSLIEKVGTSAKDFTEESHKAAFGCIEQMYLHGNSTPARNLYEAMRKAKGVRHNSFRQWLVNNTPFVWNQKEKTFVKDKSKNPEINLQHCLKHPYYEKEETVIETVSLEQLQKSVHNMIAKYEKKIQAAMVEGNVVELKAYLDTLKAMDRLKEKKTVTAS